MDGRQPSGSDGYDLWHVTAASATDVFVTHDERLAKSLVRIGPIVPEFRVVTSVASALVIS